MKSTARAVVIGGGVVGVSTLYHLAKLGWTDAVLLERKELTSGSTWHAAGLLPLFNLSYSVGKLHQYSVGPAQTLASSVHCRQTKIVVRFGMSMAMSSRSLARNRHTRARTARKTR